MDISNFYTLLNVTPMSNIKEIKNSYRNLCRLANKYNIIKAYMQQITYAYFILSNPEKRQEYDKTLNEYSKTFTNNKYSNTINNFNSINNNTIEVPYSLVNKNEVDSYNNELEEYNIIADDN
jgi:DnaJ-class molecular chaperone